MTVQIMGSFLSLVYRKPIDNVITLFVFPVPGAVLPHVGAQAPKHVSDMRKMYVYNRYCVFS